MHRKFLSIEELTHGWPVQLVAAAVPQVEGAPCLGGHNRAELPMDIATPEAAAAYLETLSTQPETRRCVTMDHKSDLAQQRVYLRV